MNFSRYVLTRHLSSFSLRDRDLTSLFSLFSFFIHLSFHFSSLSQFVHTCFTLLFFLSRQSPNNGPPLYTSKYVGRLQCFPILVFMLGKINPNPILLLTICLFVNFSWYVLTRHPTSFCCDYKVAVVPIKQPTERRVVAVN